MLPARLSAFFSLAEVTRASSPIPEMYEANVRSTIDKLTLIRGIIGVPLALTSLYRNEDRNKEVGGVATSDHKEGLAADFKPVGLSLHDFYARFLEADRAGRLPVYDQLIMYPFTTGHIHIGFGARHRGQHLIKVNEREYRVVKSVADLPIMKVGGTLFLVVVALTIAGLIFFGLRSR